MAPVGNEPAHFFGHAAAQGVVAGAECHHHPVRLFPQQPEDPLLDPLFHRTRLAAHDTALAASGVHAAIAVTGSFPGSRKIHCLIRCFIAPAWRPTTRRSRPAAGPPQTPAPPLSPPPPP